MFRASLSFLFLFAALTFFPSSTTMAESSSYSALPPGSQTNAKLALHIKSAAVKQRCAAIDALPCSQYVTSGAIQTGYDVYIVAANASIAFGIGGMEFAIDYDGAAGSGLDIFGWERCSDLEFPSNTWPASGEGTILTWATCEETEISTEGVHAIGGAFYVYAYSQDEFNIIPRPVANGLIAVADCEGGQTEVPSSQVGSLTFGSGTPGCNPCVESCADCTTVPSLLNFGTAEMGSGQVQLSTTITNNAASPLLGTVALAGNDCQQFSIISGGGPLNLATGQSQEVVVQFAPDFTGEGLQTCSLVAGDCGFVDLQGVGTLPPQDCAVTPESLNFGDQVVGTTTMDSFVIRNTNTTFQRIMDVDLGTGATCSDFSINPSGRITIPPADSVTINVSFTPSAGGTRTCSVEVTDDCEFTVPLSGNGLSESCELTPDSADYGVVPIGTSADRVFRITNTGGVLVSGNLLSTFCDGFSVVGSSFYQLQPGQFQDFTIRFQPTQEREYNCTFESGCGLAEVFGVGISGTTSAPQTAAKLAFHLTTPVTKSQCADTPSVPCSQFVSEGVVGTAYTAYVAVANLDLNEGFLGTDFGLNYGPNLEIYEWTACSDLEFPSAAWPASGTGNVLTWQACQQNYIPGYGDEGGVEFVGALYLYAYGAETLSIGPRPVPAPSPNVADCDGHESPVLEPCQGSVAFGGGFGYNPCDLATPVRLVSSVAARQGNDIEFRWQVEEDAGLGQAIYRLQESGIYEPISPLLFGEDGSYSYTLQRAPVEAVTYWIGANERDGSRTWIGSFDVGVGALKPALAVSQNRPNPFASATRLSFETSVSGWAEVSVFDLNGREVARPFAQSVNEGTHEVTWNGKDQRGHELSSGVYLYRVSAAGKTITKKMLLVRD
ncbi:MAG: choice-of-anchor D domain-containing protein [Candidatus Eisenbacteria bacterium]|uniref:Choice-of-anchor D domain-containing protein n=1 Tax=Eiseniibacteriota bacterium TaxID=2212470 RepID=A0A7Y2H3I1_UNCEI|nr:choice-of-anchor D domain-containing protein [Candidatus Eisenbacteria bacterium]